MSFLTMSFTRTVVRLSFCIVLVGTITSVNSNYPLAAWDDCETCEPNKLLILPENIVSTPDYPAKFAVYRMNDDGSYDDVTTKIVRVKSGDESIATVGQWEVHAVKPGVTNLHIAVADGTTEQNLSVAVTIENDTEFCFDREVSAVLGKAGCNLGTCHGNLHGKGGFRLSLRGDDSAFDFDRIVNEYSGRRVELFEPNNSLILKKATNSVAHLGGLRFDADSSAYERLRRWIEQGAVNHTGPQLTELKAYPSNMRLSYSDRQAHMIVQATFDDGSTRDVTNWSRIEPSIPAGVAVDDSGVVRADKPMDVAMNVAYLRGRTASRLAFLGEPVTDEQVIVHSVRNPIDQIVNGRLEELNITPEPLADDATFLRRAFLATVARLPTPAEARAYLADSTEDKRVRLIDQLIADPGFGLVWAMRWSDLLRNEDKVMSPKGAKLLHDWLRDQIVMDRPMNEMVYDLVASTGSTYDNPPASFHRTHRDPFTAAESVAQVFLGARIACAKCHNHPFDKWRQDDYYGLAAYFTTIDREQIDNMPKDGLDKHVITGDEIIKLSDRQAEIMHPGVSKMVAPSPLKRARERLVSTSEVSEAVASPLQDVGRWLTNNNAMFDRNMANRVWYQYFGRGIVDAPDDFRDSNPPSNPELLDYLAMELAKRNYSLRQISRIILTSDTFARASASDLLGDGQLPAAPYFAGFPIRRLSAEVLLDAISDSTGVPTEFRSGREEDEEAVVVWKAMEMPGVPRRTGFLTTFGKPNRLLDCECERTTEVSLGQSLSLINGLEVREKLAETTNIVSQLLQLGDNNQLLDEMYLMTLTRFPTSDERTHLASYIDQATDRRVAAEDVLWTLINSKEFIMMR